MTATATTGPDGLENRPRLTKSAILDLLYRAEQLILAGDRFEACPLIRKAYAAVRDDTPDY